MSEAVQVQTPVRLRVVFEELVVESGTKEGARALFEELVPEVVIRQHPTVRRIALNPGDGGIDSFVGDLDGIIMSWQAKFFIDGIEEAQQADIRDSFARLMKTANQMGFSVGTWTLCIPVSMDLKRTQWWDKWRKTQEKEHSLTIDLWDETRLRSYLQSPDLQSVREAYFPSTRGTSPAVPVAREVRTVPSDKDYEDMLFIKQLKAAQIVELESAKLQFFNADLLAHEIADKHVPDEMMELTRCRAEVHALWEYRYNDKAGSGSGPLLPGLHREVMEAIEVNHRALPAGLLRLGLIHRLGAMHEVVERGAAGWTRDFRRIAQEYFDGG